MDSPFRCTAWIKKNANAFNKNFLAQAREEVLNKNLPHFYRRIQWFQQNSLLPVQIIAGPLPIFHFMRVKQ